MKSTVIRNGLVLTPGGPQRADVLIRNGVVAEVGHVPEEVPDAIDAAGCWVGPGFVDLHVHLREPGQTHKEDIATGSAAAAAGGYTAVVAMPNTEPAIDNGSLARAVVQRGRDVGLVDVVAAGCLTEGRKGRHLSAISEMLAAGVRIFSDDGDTVADPELLVAAMELVAAADGLVSQHAVDPHLAAGGHLHAGAVAARLGLAGIPAEAEERIVMRDVELVRRTGVRYHLQHVSTAGTVELIRLAKEEGLAVTAEVTPHHLAFDHRDVGDGDTRFKMMPPLRSPEDVAVLRRALAEGIIDAVATDHAPHSADEKAQPFPLAPNGVTGLEWAASVVSTLLALDIETFFDRMSLAPARIGRITSHGLAVAPGNAANLVVYDPTVEYLAETTRSRSSNAPYLGRRWRGMVRHTLLRGVRTHGLVEGAVP